MATAEVPLQSNRKSRPRATSPGVDRPSLPRWVAFFLISGLYLTLRGYHSFDGDQAYRLPLLLHLQDPSLYADDPFVRAFDAFNPHRGYLTLLDWASRPLGLAAALAGLFGLTLAATAIGVDRLARSAWPELGGKVGLVALALVLAAKAGNIGTNHLFEATLLDRLIGFALGWLALASMMGDPKRGAWVGAICLGLASIIHPSIGLQLALTLAATWGVWWIWPTRFGVERMSSSLAIGALGLALAPSLAWNAGQAGRLFAGLPPEEFRALAVMVQGPQHMLPSTWRVSQWLAWGCYPVLGLLALGKIGFVPSRDPWPLARIRLASLMGVNLLSLGLAYVAVEVVGDLKVTIFQPFRMATLARGLALVVVSGRLIGLWARGDLASRGRAVLVGVGLGGDWSLVVATAVDAGMAVVEWAALRRTMPSSKIFSYSIGLMTLALGLTFLIRHDTESGHFTLLAGLGALGLGTLAANWVRFCWNPRRVALAMVGAWAIPAAALVVPWVVADPGSRPWSAGLVGRCRFAEVPIDDLERLATWCRDQTPASSRFIGPPGPKTFRLWSRRTLAFNRAASPYHAEGLADWATRYRDHVGFDGSTAEFARAYLPDHGHALEAGYGRMTDAELADLARRQGATHILVPSARPSGDPAGPLERLRVEGRWAIERVRTAD
jgi:hypothetical protein